MNYYKLLYFVMFIAFLYAIFKIKSIKKEMFSLLKRKKVKFSNVVSVYQTYSPDEYNRSYKNHNNQSDSKITQ